MALTCIGIYKTPKEIIDIMDGSNTVVWEKLGAFEPLSHTIAGLNKALSDWRSNPAVFATPIVKVIEDSHFVVVTGIEENGDFIVVDPAKAPDNSFGIGSQGAVRQVPAANHYKNRYRSLGEHRAFKLHERVQILHDRTLQAK